MRNLFFLIYFVIFFVFIGCSNRPSEVETKHLFLKENPNDSVLSVRLVEDEAICRTFIIKFFDDSLKRVSEQTLIYFDESKAFTKQNNF